MITKVPDAQFSLSHCVYFPLPSEINSGVTVYFIPRIFYPGDSIFYPPGYYTLGYFIRAPDILSWCETFRTRVDSYSAMASAITEERYQELLDYLLEYGVVDPFIQAVSQLTRNVDSDNRRHVSRRRMESCFTHQLAVNTSVFAAWWWPQQREQD
jgi:hypothetical protein